MKLSEHFSLEEAIFSDTAIRLGIDNTPNFEILHNMGIAAGELEKLRVKLNKPLIITSWYRSKELNAKIPGSSTTSAHTSGFAIDCHTKDMDIISLCKYAASSCVFFDQIIHEYGRWMHISFDPKARRRLTTIFSGGQGYKTGLLTEKEYFYKP